MKTTGRHRSLALAERHARQLARQHGGVWAIVARRTDDGRFSAHGHNFTFEQQPDEDEEDEGEDEEPDMAEFAVSTSYKGSKSNPVNIQFSIQAPAKATKQQVIDAINAHIDGDQLPKNYSVKAMVWNDKASQNITRDTAAFAAPLAFSTVSVRRHRRS